MTDINQEHHKPLTALFPNCGDSETFVSKVCLNSREVTEGALFFAYPGDSRDGREYIPQAIANGAKVIVYEQDDNHPLSSPGVVFISEKNLREKVGDIAARFYDYPSLAMNVIGVTGTNGKTSITHFLAQAFAREGAKAAVIGTLGNGLLNKLEKTTHTTPDPVFLQHTLTRFLHKGITHVAMEASSHALDQSRLAGVAFDTAVFTQLTRDHLDYHHDMQAYAKAKERLLQQPGLRQAVINADDEFGQELIHNYSGQLDIIAYSADPSIKNNNSAQQYLRVCAIKSHAQGFSVEIKSSFGEGEFICPMLGRFNISNILATLGVLLFNGISFSTALRYCSELMPVKGRMQVFGGNAQPKVVVDYAHTPNALFLVLKSLREHCQGKIWCVFGCGGNRDKGKRSQMAAIAEKLADHIIITDDNPRHESSGAIAMDILAGIKQLDAVKVISNRAQAIQTAVQSANINDIVLIAGKGHENTQTVGDQVLAFDDASEVLLALGKK